MRSNTLKYRFFYVILYATIKLNTVIMYGGKFKALERVQENHKMMVNIHFPLFVYLQMSCQQYKIILLTKAETEKFKIHGMGQSLVSDNPAYHFNLFPSFHEKA